MEFTYSEKNKLMSLLDKDIKRKKRRIKRIRQGKEKYDPVCIIPYLEMEIRCAEDLLKRIEDEA
jgi:hypothetical protein